MDNKDGHYFWVIGGGLLQIPLIHEARTLGLKTIVSDLNPQCAARAHADLFAHIDIFDIEGHLSFLKLNTELKIAGVLAAGIDAPETMAAMNNFLGIKSISIDQALLCKQKDLFRHKLTELGYDQVNFVVIRQDNAHLIHTQSTTLNFPVIVKPPANSASRDMKIFHANGEPLTKYVTRLLDRYPKVIIEEMWTGPEQTVECIIDIQEKFHRGFITDRKFTFENDYPIETGLVHPTELSANQQEALYTLAERIANDLNIKIGAIKLDTIYTPSGPRIIEMTLRHSGGFDCQYVFPYSTGKNLLKAAILTAIGETIPAELFVEKYKKYTVTGSVWPKPGTIRRITGIQAAERIPEVKNVFVRFDIGDIINEYKDCASRVAFIIATADTREAAGLALKKAQSLIRIETE